MGWKLVMERRSFDGRSLRGCCGRRKLLQTSIAMVLSNCGDLGWVTLVTALLYYQGNFLCFPLTCCSSSSLGSFFLRSFTHAWSIDSEGGGVVKIEWKHSL